MSDAAVTALVSGGAAVLGALVRGMSSCFVQKSANLEKQVEQRSAAFVGFLTAARQVLELRSSGDQDHRDQVWRDFESCYLEVQLYAVNYVADPRTGVQVAPGEGALDGSGAALYSGTTTAGDDVGGTRRRDAGGSSVTRATPG